MPVVSRRVPHSVTIMRYGVFIFGFVNLWQASAIDRQLYLLQRWNPSLDPRLRALFAFAWAWWFIGLGIGLWIKRPFTRIAIPISILGYMLYSLLLLWLTRSSVAQAGWPGNLVFGCAAVAFSCWALCRAAVKPYFDP